MEADVPYSNFEDDDMSEFEESCPRRSEAGEFDVVDPQEAAGVGEGEFEWVSPHHWRNFIAEELWELFSFDTEE